MKGRGIILTDKRLEILEYKYKYYGEFVVPYISVTALHTHYYRVQHRYWHLQNTLSGKLGRARGQVNQRFLTEELLVHFQGSPYRFCSELGDIGTGFSPGSSVSPVIVYKLLPIYLSATERTKGLTAVASTYNPTSLEE